jgi:hypothetical protein
MHVLCAANLPLLLEILSVLTRARSHSHQNAAVADSYPLGTRNSGRRIALIRCNCAASAIMSDWFMFVVAVAVVASVGVIAYTAFHGL